MKVGIKEDEYTTAKSKISSVHQESLSQIDTALAKLKALNVKKGGFYADEISPNIDAMIAEIKSAKVKIEKAYNLHEDTIDSFIRAIENYDTCC